LRLTAGVWSEIARANEVLLPVAVDRVIGMDDAVLFNSSMPRRLLGRMRAAGFRTVGLEISEVELRRPPLGRGMDECPVAGLGPRSPETAP
jgi:hypothetical protein